MYHAMLDELRPPSMDHKEVLKLNFSTGKVYYVQKLV